MAIGLVAQARLIVTRLTLRGDGVSRAEDCIDGPQLRGGAEGGKRQAMLIARAGGLPNVGISSCGRSTTSSAGLQGGVSFISLVCCGPTSADAGRV